jgi:hypothetical protein
MSRGVSPMNGPRHELAGATTVQPYLHARLDSDGNVGPANDLVVGRRPAEVSREREPELEEAGT